MATVTVKNLPADLHLRLKERAERYGRSLNSEILACLREVTEPRVVDAEALLAEVRRLRAQVGGRISEALLRESRIAGRP